MNDQPGAKLDGLLANATEALRRTVSTAPSRELIDATIDRIRSLEAGSQVTSTARDAVLASHTRSKSPRRVRYGAFAAAAVIFALLTGTWIFLDRAAMPAFAAVMQQVAKAKSVTFVSVSTLRSDLTNEVIRKELVRWYVEGERIRMEDLSGGVAIIADLDQQRTYQLDLKRKTAATDPLNDEIAEMIANPFAQVQQVEANDAKLLGAEVLDGRAVLLYQVDDVAFLVMGGRGTTKIWVDPATQLPVRIVIEPKKRKDRSVSIEISDFEWNKKLDASLFEVPRGYTMVDVRDWMRERQAGRPERD